MPAALGDEAAALDVVLDAAAARREDGLVWQPSASYSDRACRRCWWVWRRRRWWGLLDGHWGRSADRCNVLSVGCKLSATVAEHRRFPTAVAKQRSLGAALRTIVVASRSAVQHTSDVRCTNLLRDTGTNLLRDTGTIHMDRPPP